MIEKIKALALILERMDALYLRILGLLEREREALIRLDYESLYASLQEKDEVLSALRGLDKDRLRLQDWFAVIMDVEPEELTLKFIGDSLNENGDPENGLRLLALRDKLGKTVGVVTDKVNRNMQFIDRSVDNLQRIASSFMAAVTGKPGKSSRGMNVYNGKKKYEEVTTHKGSILEKRL